MKDVASGYPKFGCFQKIGVPQNGWFIMENPIKMDDLGVPLFSETSKFEKNPYRGCLLVPCFGPLFNVSLLACHGLKGSSSNPVPTKLSFVSGFPLLNRELEL